jgi:Tfp pilus assembly major pilin PilA
MTCCKKLGITEIPEAYLLHGNGVFNALATRFLGRNFVVLFSDVIDALESQPGAINFYMGHELGHIRRNHLRWRPLLWPASFLPLLGAAYSRACEYTCDLYGLACCESPEIAARGLAALAAGDKRWHSMQLDAYMQQGAKTTGFWMSFHELISSYPWLVKRMMRILPDRTKVAPRRSGFAWLLALFVPRLGVGTGAAPLIVIAVIGILAAIAIPAYQDYIIRAKLSEAMVQGEQVMAAVADYYYKNHAVPNRLEDTGVSSSTSVNIKEMTVDSRSGVIRFVIAVPPLQGKSLLFVPSLDKKNAIAWTCGSEDIPAKYLPIKCRQPVDKK